MNRIDYFLFINILYAIYISLASFYSLIFLYMTIITIIFFGEPLTIYLMYKIDKN